MSGIGILMGGAGAVRAQNMNAETASRQVDLTAQNDQAKLQQEQLKNFQTSYENIVKQSLDTVQKTLTEAQKGDDEAFKNAQAAAGQLIKYTLDVGSQLVQHGIIDGARLRQIDGLLQGATNVPPPSVINQQATQQAGAVAGAQAQGTASVQGVPLETVANPNNPSQGMLVPRSDAAGKPVPLTGQQNQPQTAAGKQIFDQELIKRVYGENSPQAKAFSDLINAPDDVKLTNVSSIRKEFTSSSQDFVSVRDAYNKINVAVKDPSAAGDIGLIFNFMKMLDPGSTVREGEFATAQNSAGVPDQVRNTFNRLMNGERLNPEQRNDFEHTARKIMDSQIQTQHQLEDSFRSIAKRNRINPDDVVIDFIGNLPKEVEKELTDIDKMPYADVLNLDLNNLTAKEREAVRRRVEQRR